MEITLQFTVKPRDIRSHSSTRNFSRFMFLLKLDRQKIFISSHN